MKDSLIVEADVMVPMRDGVRLRTDIYRPAAEGRYPVLLLRNPYTHTPGLYDPWARQIAGQGYVVGIQFCRGRGGSEGTFYPVHCDVDDGYDFVEWAAVQEWSNGKVGVFGRSYHGFAAWAAALGRPPHLVAIVPGSSQWNFTERNGWRYYAPGVLSGLSVRWSVLMAVDEANARGVPLAPEFVSFEATRLAALIDEEGEVAAEWANLGEKLVRELFARGPLRDLAEFEETAPWFKDWCDHDDPRDPYWTKVSARDHIDEWGLPVLHVSGWFDYFVHGSLDAFQTIQKFGITEAVRTGQRLVIGPWYHSRGIPRPDAEPGAELAWVSYTPQSPEMRFLDHYLKGEHPSYEQEPPVRIYVMGDNRWREEWEWPLARTDWASYYLDSGGHANTTAGDGLLSRDLPNKTSVDRFVYDPAHPVPGDIAIGRESYPRSVDVGEVGLRADVLVYTTPALSADLEVTGPISLELWASSTVADTDFTAKLIDVFPDGEPVPLCQGVVRTAKATAHPAIPGAVYRYDIDMWDTSNVFKAGHRIQLYISSSEFPTYELNPNTGRRITHDPSGETVPATQQIFHDTARPSRLVLPIIPR